MRDDEATPEDTDELEAIRRLLEEGTGPRRERAAPPGFRVDGPPPESRAGSVPGHATRPGPTGGALSAAEREDLSRLLEARADAAARRHLLTSRLERLAVLWEPNEERSLLFVRDQRDERELLVTRLAPTLAHEVSDDGRLAALVRRLERLEPDTVARPLFVVAARDGAPLVGWRLPPGASLADELRRRGALRPPHALAVARHVVRALDQAHRAGLVHGALDLENVWLLDRVPWTDSNPHGVGVELVELGFGTWNGGGTAPRAADDVRDAARLFYGLLVGSRPDERASPHADLRGLPDRWGRTLARALDPARGYPDAATFLRELERLDAPVRDALRWRAAAGVLFATSVGVLAWKGVADARTDASTDEETEARAAAAGEEIVRLEGRVASLRDQLFQAERSRTEEVGERERLAALVAGLDRELADLRAQDELDATVRAELERLTDEHEALAGAFARRVADADSAGEAARLALGELRGELEAREEERTSLARRLEDDARERERALDDWRGRLAAADAELAQVRAEREALGLALERAEESLAAERARAAGRTGELDAALAATSGERDEALATAAAQSARATEAERDAAAARAENASLEAQKTALESRWTALEGELAEARAELERTTEALVEARRTTPTDQAREEARREAERRTAAEAARSRATIELLEARVRALSDELRRATRRGDELDARLRELEAERDALLERLEDALGGSYRRLRGTSAAPPPPSAPSLQDGPPSGDEARDELERLRTVLAATAAENAALSRALAERDAEETRRHADLEDRVAELERELAGARADAEALRAELVEADDVLLARTETARKLDLARSEADAERGAADAARAERDALARRLDELEARWLRREAELATAERARALELRDRRAEEREVTRGERRAERRAEELERSLLAARRAADEVEARVGAELEEARVSLAAAERRVERLLAERAQLEQDLDLALSTPRRDRALERRVTSLEAERATLVDALEAERVAYRRRLEGRVARRLAEEHATLADELATERARGLELVTRLEEVRGAQAAERARLAEETAALRADLDEAAAGAGRATVELDLARARATKADARAEELEGQLVSARATLEQERETASRAVGEAIALRGERDGLRAELARDREALGALERRFDSLLTERRRRLEHSAAPALAWRVDALLEALEAGDLARAVEARAALERGGWSDATTLALADALLALEREHRPLSAAAEVEVLLAAAERRDAALDAARRAWSALDAGAPWLWEPTSPDLGTEEDPARAARVDALLARAHARRDALATERRGRLELVWRERVEDVDVPFASTTRLARALGHDLAPLAERFAARAWNAAGAGEVVATGDLARLEHLDSWAVGLVEERPYDAATRRLAAVRFARDLRRDEPLGPVPPALPLARADDPAWLESAVELARALREPAAGFGVGGRSTWRDVDGEHEVRVLRRVRGEGDDRVRLTVTRRGAEETWTLHDRAWVRRDEAGRELGRLDVGTLAPAGRWLDANGTSWSAYEGPGGRLLPRLGPGAWYAADGTGLELVAVTETGSRERPALDD